MRKFLFIVALTAFAAPALGQSQAIQPCEATPSTSKSISAPAKTAVRSETIVVDAKIPDDAAVEKMLAPYSAKVRALSMVIGRLDAPLKKETVGAGTLGNFVTDGIKTYAQRKLRKPIALAMTNAGGLRKNEIAAGELRATDIFELLPFENALVEVELTGADLIKLLPALVRDAQSGARIQYKWNDQNRPEFVSGKLIDENGREQEIDPNKIYTIVTIDYLLKLGSGAYVFLQEAKSTKPLNIMTRDAIIDYVKNETAAGRTIRVRAGDRYVQIGPGPKTTQEPR